MSAEPSQPQTEKYDLENVENKLGQSAQEYDEYLRLENEVFVGKKKKQLLRRMDLRVTLPIAFVYLVGYVDRTNIGNARLFGLEKDLNITAQQYNYVLMSFFFTYAFFEVPSQILNKKIGPRLFISLVMTGFGVVTVCKALTTNYAGIITCRLMLGIFESGLFPGAIYILSFWYSKWELQTRVAVFYAGASASGAFAGLLAYAIAELDNTLGYRAWRWIFGIEGIATTLIGISCLFFISEAPAKAKWLSAEEQRYLLLRQTYYHGPNPTTSHFDWRYVRQAFYDYKSYIVAFMFWGTAIPVYGLSFTMPVIMNSLGYTAQRSQALTAPPYIFAAIVCVLTSMASDRYKVRGWFLVGAFTVALVGFAIVMGTARYSHLTGVTLFGIFVTAAGLYSATPPMMTWISNVIAGEVKRGIVLSIIPTIGQFGGVIGSNIYLAKERPAYPLGFGMSIAAVFFFGVVPSLLLRFMLSYENRKRDRVSESEIREKYSEDELAELGDKSPLFRYPL